MSGDTRQDVAERGGRSFSLNCKRRCVSTLAPVLAMLLGGASGFTAHRTVSAFAQPTPFRATHSAGSFTVPSMRSVLTATGPHVSRAALLRAAAAATGPHLGARASVRDAADAQSLQIPWAAFPSGTKNETGATMSPSDADDGSKNPFGAGFHNDSYRTHGMQGGFFQTADIPVNGAGDVLPVAWLGSYYDTQSNAAGRVADAVRVIQAQGFRPQSCYIPDGPDCKLFIFPTNLMYVIWSDQNTVGELLLIPAANAIVVQNAGTVGGIIQTILKAGDQTLLAAAGAPGAGTPDTSPPPLPTLGLDSQQILHNVAGQLKSTKVLLMREDAIFVAKFHESAAGTYGPDSTLRLYNPRGRVTFLKNGQSIFEGPADGASDPYAVLFGSFTDTKAVGKLTVKFTLQIASSTGSHSQDFTLKKRPPRAG